MTQFFRASDRARHATVASCLAVLASTAPAQDESQLEAAKRMLETAEEVIQEVEEIRGWKFKRKVKQDVRTEDQLREYIAGKLEEEWADGALERSEAWLKQLQLVRPDESIRETTMDVLINQIGGFYDPAENSFFMMVESARLGETVNRMLIAHELCHALDDQYVDLANLIDPADGDLTEDQSYAVGAVVEGSATALMYVWMAHARRKGDVDLKSMLEMQKSEMERAKPMIEAPRYFSLLVANYIVGQHFITRGGSATDAATQEDPDSGGAILDVVKDMPRSTEQVLHPEKYWDPELRDEPVVVSNDDAVAAAIETRSGKVVVERNTLGELICSLTTISPAKRTNMALMAQASYWTNKYSRGWGGDRLYVLGNRTEDGGQDLSDPGLVWLTMWDSEKDCEEFVKAVQRHRGESPGFAVHVDGATATFGFGSHLEDPTDLARVLAAAEFLKDGAAWQP